jgi:hypothetical protein
MAIKVNTDAVSRARKLYTSENTDLVDSMIGDSDDDELLEATERSLDSKYTDYQLGVKGSALGSAEAEANFYNGKKYNPLHKYNSYNYIFTLSSLTADQLKTPENYGNFIQAIFGNGREASTNYIVLRSGGYPRTKVDVAVTDTHSDPEYGITPDNSVNGKTGGSGFKHLSGNPGATNAKHKDLFIDNVVMETVMDLGASGVSNLTTGSFEVTEPYSVAGFYEELYNASRFAGHEHYLGAPFLLSLSFVGHRLEDGKLKTEIADRSTRHFPIIFTGSNMNVSAAGARYSVQFAGFNSRANTTIANRLPQNIKGPQQATPSVSSVLTYLFDKVNDVVRKEAEEQEKGQNNDSLKKIEQNEAASRKRIQSAQAKNSNLKVGPYQHHNYAIWFPKKYGTNSKDELGTILQGDAFPKWESGAKDFLSPETSEDDTSLNIKKYSTDVKLDISNAIGDSAMQVTESSYTGFYSVPDLDKKVSDSDEKIKNKVKEIKGLKTDYSKAYVDAEKARKEFEEQAKKYYKLNDAEIKDFRERYSTVYEGEAMYENKSTISYNEFRDLNPDGTANTKDTTPPEVSSDTQEALNKLMLNYQQTIKKQNEAKRALNRAGIELEKLQEAKDSVYDEKYVRYGTSKSARNWSFKKETSLEENIHKVIFDSVYVTELDGGELAQEYNKTGYIPWYRIEKIAHLKGFDTFTNTEVYDYHFIIQPFLVHYSSLPLPVSKYDYTVLKEKAVREYNYIYTGKNIDVLGFDIDFNNLFAAAALYKPQQGAEGSTGTETKEKENVRPPLSDVIQALGGNRVGQKRTVAVNQTSSTTQTAPTANNRADTAKFLHDALYSGSYEKSLINAEIEIVGDPVYLLGSGITSRASLDATNVETEAGEINCFSREGDIVFRFGTAEDMPTSDELKGGQNTMILDQSVYSGAYKVISCTSTFNEGMFMQKLLTYRRPNQANDYVETRDSNNAVIESVKETDKSTAPSSQENLDKAEKSPVRKLSKEDLENLNYHGPGALGGISRQATVEIPSANLGLNPAALGGSVFRTVAEAQTIAGELAAGTFDIKNFVPESAMKSIETVNGVTSVVTAGTNTIKNTAGTSNITNASNFAGKVNDIT